MSIFRRPPQPEFSPVGRFAFEAVPSPLLDTMYRPIVSVQLWSAKAKKWRSIQMLLDTGADYSIIPSYIAVWLEIDMSKAREQPTTGIGGHQTIQFLDNVKIKIGSAERQIPLGVIQSTKVPPLLGRHDCLDTFQVLLNKRSEVVFSE